MAFDGHATRVVAGSADKAVPMHHARDHRIIGSRRGARQSCSISGEDSHALAALGLREHWARGVVIGLAASVLVFAAITLTFAATTDLLSDGTAGFLPGVPLACLRDGAVASDSVVWNLLTPLIPVEPRPFFVNCER
jgi:hypothetical protein